MVRGHHARPQLRGEFVLETRNNAALALSLAILRVICVLVGVYAALLEREHAGCRPDRPMPPAAPDFIDLPSRPRLT